MPYDPSTIVLLNFGRYSKDKNGNRKKTLPSITQIPLAHPDGFGYISGFLSNPEKTGRIIIEPDDLVYIRSVSDALEEFPVHVRCEGRSGECRSSSSCLVLPYARDRNFVERVRRGGPEVINQTYVLDSSFRCYSCAAEKEYEKSGKVLKLNISFRLPDILTRKPEKLGWNVDRQELHGKMRKIAWMLAKYGIDGLITPGEAACSSPRMDIYSSQDIISRLLKFPVENIPASKKDYKKRKLRWHLSDHEMSGQLVLPII